MATDNRGHTVPAAGDVPSRNTLLNLSLSTCDVVPVTNTTTRATAVTNLGATTAKPLIVARADARSDSLLEISSDSGTTWRTVVLGTPLTAYTPALTSTGTTPTLGTGATQVGAFVQFGNWAEGYAEIVFGTSGFVAGTGTYRVSLPVTLTAAAVAAGRVIGDGLYFDATGNFYHVILVASTTTAATMVLDNSGALSATSPVVPAINDQLRYRFATEVV